MYLFLNCTIYHEAITLDTAKVIIFFFSITIYLQFIPINYLDRERLMLKPNDVDEVGNEALVTMGVLT